MCGVCASVLFSALIPDVFLFGVDLDVVFTNTLFNTSMNTLLNTNTLCIRVGMTQTTLAPRWAGCSV